MHCYLRSFRLNRKGVVALWVAVAAPALLASVGAGVQVGQYAVARGELQVASDAAAYAGAKALGASGNTQMAANVAANVAEVNGVAGSASRSWVSSSKTLTDGRITVTIGPGVTSAANTAVTVTVSRSINGAFALLVGGTATQTITATSTADSVPGATGGQPCLLALGTNADSLSLSGSITVTGRNCNMRSNGGLQINGSGTIDVAAIYTGGSITTIGSPSITGDQNQNAGTITDPFLSYAPLQAALASLNPGSGTPYTMSGSNTATINPGTYSSISLKNSQQLTLNPGLYMVNGNISLSGSSQISGTGVTIISSGSISFGGTSSINLSAPDSHTTSGGVPGVLYASTSTSASSVTGTAGMPVSGLIYTPNASMTFTGTSGVNGCTEVVALQLTMTGTSSTEANCAVYGLPQYGSVAGSAAARLVR